MTRRVRETEAKILRIIRENELISRADISRRSGLSKPVVSTIVRDFIAEGVVIEAKEGPSSKAGGKRPVLLSFVPSYRHVLGIDIGGSNLTAVLSDLNGKVVRSNRFSTRSIKNEDELLGAVCKAVDSILDIPHESILGVGVGVPGTVDPETGMVFHMPAFGLKNVNLRPKLQQRLDLPVFIANDVTLHALGEMWIGAAKNCRNVFLVSLGTGTGGGIIVNKLLYEGSNGLAGEVGYMITDWSKEKDMSFAFGSLESWFSGYAFERILARFDSGSTVRQLFEEVDTNERFREIVSSACEHLAVMLANTISLLDPEIVVINGGIGYNQFDRIMRFIMPLLEKVIPEEILSKVSFRRGVLAEFGAAIGSVCYVQRKSFMEV